MAMFDLAQYATVAERIQILYKEYPDARIITENLTTLQDRQVSTWVFKATLYLTDADQERGLPKATGHAFEIDGQGMANKTSAMENAESSAVGRCLALAGWSGNKKQTALASAEEMKKVARDVTPVAPADPWLLEAETLAKSGDIVALRGLYSDAVRLKISAPILEKIKEIATNAK
jgi:hypothetical protein